jgi:hypothetical protein
VLYKLLNYVNELRDRFDDYEVKGKIISKCEKYEKDEQRKRNISKWLDKYNENEVILEGKEIKQEYSQFGQGASIVLQLSERINVPNCRLVFENFFQYILTV